VQKILDRFRCRAGVLLCAGIGICLIGRPARLCAQDAGGHQEHPGDHQAADTPYPETTLRAFGAVQWLGSQLSGVPNSFSLGQLSLFVRSNISDRVSMLAEVVLEAHLTANTQVATDLERLQVTFRANDSFEISAGRYHSAIGFYNVAFHHGTYFETPIGRPRVFQFEDDGGALPIHELGVTARGVVPQTASSLRWIAEVGNGRSWTTPNQESPSEGGPDTNGAKSTNVGLSFRPPRTTGFEAGASFYRDAIPLGATSTVDHRIAALYVAYRTPSTEVLAEWLRLTHETQDGALYRNHGGYFQASRAWGPLRPYYRYDRLDINPLTPFIGTIGSYKAHVVGLRIDPVEWVGFKVQYERTDESGQFGVNGLRTQLVFVF
jgi:hypothetical protein